MADMRLVLRVENDGAIVSRLPIDDTQPLLQPRPGGVAPGIAKGKVISSRYGLLVAEMRTPGFVERDARPMVGGVAPVHRLVHPAARAAVRVDDGLRAFIDIADVRRARTIEHHEWVPP